MLPDSKIFVAGHRGLVGSAIVEKLRNKGYSNILTRSHKELDLTRQQDVEAFFEEHQPEYVFLAAAKVGGIWANNHYRADFLYDNLCIQNNVIHNAFKYKAKKLLFLGSTCIYPKNCLQPIKEEYLLTDELEYTNEPYAIAKIAGLKLCENYNLQYGTNFLAAMPTNLYGPNDNFDFENSHVMPALIRKIHLAKMFHEQKTDEVMHDLKVDTPELASETLQKYGIGNNQIEIWGSGRPRREFLWSADLADACVFMMEEVNFGDIVQGSEGQIKNTHVNVGTGKDISIRELAELIGKVIGYSGSFVFNSAKPDGTFQKVTDITKISSLGWKHSVELEEGIRKMYTWYLQNLQKK